MKSKGYVWNMTLTVRTNILVENAGAGVRGTECGMWDAECGCRAGAECGERSEWDLLSEIRTLINWNNISIKSQIHRLYWHELFHFESFEFDINLVRNWWKDFVHQSNTGFHPPSLSCAFRGSGTGGLRGRAVFPQKQKRGPKSHQKPISVRQ